MFIKVISSLIDWLSESRGWTWCIVSWKHIYWVKLSLIDWTVLNYSGCVLATRLQYDGLLQFQCDIFLLSHSFWCYRKKHQVLPRSIRLLEAMCQFPSTTNRQSLEISTWKWLREGTERKAKQKGLGLKIFYTKNKSNSDLVSSAEVKDILSSGETWQGRLLTERGGFLPRACNRLLLSQRCDSKCSLYVAHGEGCSDEHLPLGSFIILTKYMLVVLHLCAL